MRALHHALRSYDSWPIQLQVHTPNWSNIEDYRKNRPEVFQLNSAGGRDYDMLCYSNPKTLETYLENIDKKIKGDQSANIGMIGDTITVCPNDAELRCFCPDCRKLWNDKGGASGSASRVVATFTVKLAQDVQKRCERRTRDLVLAAVDGQVHALPNWSRARRTSSGSIFRR